MIDVAGGLKAGLGVVCGVVKIVAIVVISVEGVASDVETGFILDFGKDLKLKKLLKGSKKAGKAPGGWNLV